MNDFLSYVFNLIIFLLAKIHLVLENAIFEKLSK